jgi:hypothetical protein
MGQLVVQEFVSADGFAADANNDFTFYEYLSGGTAEFDRSQLKWLETVDTMVLGAKTYREFVEYWPTQVRDGACFLSSNVHKCCPCKVQQQMSKG